MYGDLEVFFDESDNVFSDVSGNDSNLTVYNFDDSASVDMLSGISQQLQVIESKLGDNSPAVLSSDRSIVLDHLRAYYFRANGEYVYIPFDKIEYIEKTLSGELVNISSGTITCYSLDRNGNAVNQYRLQPFSKVQQYVYGYDNQSYQHWYWTSIYVNADDSNLRFGQTGISNFTDFLLFGIMAFVAIIAFFKKR